MGTIHAVRAKAKDIVRCNQANRELIDAEAVNLFVEQAVDVSATLPNCRIGD